MREITDRTAMLVSLSILADGDPKFYKGYIGFPVRYANGAVHWYWIGDQHALRIGRPGLHPRKALSYSLSSHAKWLQRRGRAAVDKLDLRPRDLRYLGERRGADNRARIRVAAENFRAARSR